MILWIFNWCFRMKNSMNPLFCKIHKFDLWCRLMTYDLMFVDLGLVYVVLLISMVIYVIVLWINGELRKDDCVYWKRVRWPNILIDVELIQNCSCVVWSTYGGSVYFLFLLWSWPCRHYYMNCRSIMLWYIWRYNVMLVMWSNMTMYKVLWPTWMYKERV